MSDRDEGYVGARAHPHYLEGEASVTASGSETDVTGWNRGGSDTLIPEKPFEGDPTTGSPTEHDYIDVRKFSYIEILADMGGTDGDVAVYEKVARNTPEQNTATVTVTANTQETIIATSVEGTSFLRVTSTQSADLYIAGRA